MIQHRRDQVVNDNQVEPPECVIEEGEVLLPAAAAVCAICVYACLHVRMNECMHVVDTHTQWLRHTHTHPHTGAGVGGGRADVDRRRRCAHEELSRHQHLPPAG